MFGKSSGNPVMTLTETNSEDTNSNDLRGISDRDLRTSVIANISDAKLLKKTRISYSNEKIFIYFLLINRNICIFAHRIIY